MNEKVKEVFVLMFFGSAVGAWAGYFLAAANAQNNAIQQECAHYDSKTGEFKWGSMQ